MERKEKGLLKRLWSKRWFKITLISTLLLFSFIFYFRYYFVYSEGTRVGILYKFSKKGTIFKTFEGEMVLPGMKAKSDKAMSSNLFHFSVTDDAIADTLSKIQGMEVELHYKQYNNSLVWRGDNYHDSDGQYIVDKLVRIKNKNPNGYGL